MFAILYLQPTSRNLVLLTRRIAIITNVKFLISMSSKKEVERSASTQGDSIRSDKARNPSKKGREATSEFKNFGAKNLKVRISSPHSELEDQTPFEELFTLINQACILSPS